MNTALKFRQYKSSYSVHKVFKDRWNEDSQLFYKGLSITERKQVYQTDGRSTCAIRRVIDRDSSVQQSNRTRS